MSQRIWRAVLVVSGLGFPLTQLVIRRFGRPGAVVVEVVCGGLLVRDAVLIATGVPGLLRRGPATLLWLEVATGVAAVLTGLRPLGNADALHRAGKAAPTGARRRAGRRSGRCSGCTPFDSGYTCNPARGSRAANRRVHPLMSRPASALRPWTCQTNEFLRLCDQAGPGCALAAAEGSATRWDATLAPGGAPSYPESRSPRCPPRWLPQSRSPSPR